MKMIRNNVYLTPKEEEGIAQIIASNGAGSKAEIVRRALDEYIEKYNLNNKDKENE